MNKKYFLIFLLIIVFSFNLFTLAKRLDINVKPIIKDEEQHEEQHIIRVSCIGDSITYGYGIEHINYSWVHLLSKKLGIDYKTTNYGLSNRTLLSTSDDPYFDEEMADIFWNDEEEIVLIMLGTNDSKIINWNAEKFEEEYEELIQKLRQKKNHPKIYLMLPPKIFAEGDDIYFPNNKTLKNEVIPIIRVIAEKYNLEVINLYKLTSNHPEWFWDNLHPNREGHEAIADEIARVIKETYVNKPKLIQVKY